MYIHLEFSPVLLIEDWICVTRVQSSIKFRWCVVRTVMPDDASRIIVEYRIVYHRLYFWLMNMLLCLHVHICSSLPVPLLQTLLSLHPLTSTMRGWPVGRAWGSLLCHEGRMERRGEGERRSPCSSRMRPKEKSGRRNRRYMYHVLHVCTCTYTSTCCYNTHKLCMYI